MWLEPQQKILSLPPTHTFCLGLGNYHLWMCGTSKNGDQKLREGKESEPYDYISKPFLDHKFEPHGWMDVLATITICVNDVTSTLFCDQEGYDVILVQMINVLYIQNKEHIALELSKEPSLEAKVRHVKVENEISTFEVSSGHETEGENQYVASDELEELDTLEIPETLDQPIIFKT